MQEITFFNFNDWKCICSKFTYNKKQIPVFAKKLLGNYKEITPIKKSILTCLYFFMESTESILFWYLYRTYAKVQKHF